VVVVTGTLGVKPVMGLLGTVFTGTLGAEPVMGLWELKNTRVSGGNELVVGADDADAPDAGADAARRESPDAGVALADAALADAPDAGAAYIGARSIGPPPPGAPTREKYCG
jgi:hypothetical protein